MTKDGIDPRDNFWHNNRINPDWQCRCAPLPAGYAERSRQIEDETILPL